MMKLLKEPRTRRRMLFLLGNLAALVAFTSIFVVPLDDMFAERDAKIEQQAKRLSRLTAIANEAARVESIVAQAKTQMQTGEFLTGANENVISAELQAKLKAMTEGVGARSRAIQALPMKTDQIKSVGARIEIFGPLQSIARAVYAIETAKPYLFISAASLKLVPGSRPGTSEGPVVQAQLDVFGAVQIGAQP
jgi:general secretion pathway protein M